MENLLTISGLKKRLSAVYPTIVFFLLLFLFITFALGLQYLLLLSAFTIFFSSRRLVYLSVRDFMQFIFQFFLLFFLAFFATLNFPLMLLMNLLVPFAVVVLQSNQFKMKAYFSSIATFLFLQLRPVGWSGLGTLLLNYSLCLLFLVVSLALNQLIFRKNIGMKPQVTLRPLGRALKLSSVSLLTEQELSKLFSLQYLYLKDLQKKDLQPGRMSSTNRIYYLAGLMYQRSFYFLANLQEQDGKRSDEERVLLAQLGNLIEQTSTTERGTKTIEAALHKLVAYRGIVPSPTLAYLSNTLSILVSIKTPESATTQRLDVWRRVKEFGSILLERISYDRFEFRFACQLSVVISTSMTFSYLTGFEHSYWLPLNAFLLLQPFKDENIERGKTRLLGTILGAGISSLIVILIPGSLPKILLGLLFGVLLYIAYPGTWENAMFSSSFALLLTSFSLPYAYASELRLIYLISAIALVLIVSHVIFPITKKGQLRQNLTQLCLLQLIYLDIFERAIQQEYELWRMREALVQFQLLYSQLRGAVKQLTECNQRAYYELFLKNSWLLFIEIEQMILMLRRNPADETQKQRLNRFYHERKAQLQQIQKHLFQPKGEIVPIPQLPQTDADYMTIMMQQYTRHVEQLL